MAAAHLSHPGLVLCQVALLIAGAAPGSCSLERERHVAPGKCRTYAASQTFSLSQFQGPWFVSYQFHDHKYLTCQNFTFTSSCGETTMTIKGYGTTEECVSHSQEGIAYAPNPKTPGAMTWYWDHPGALTDHVTMVDTDHQNYAVLIVCNDLGLVHLNHAILLTRKENVPENTALIASYVDKTQDAIQPFFFLHDYPFYYNRCDLSCRQGGHRDKDYSVDHIVGQTFPLPQDKAKAAAHIEKMVDQSSNKTGFVVSSAWGRGAPEPGGGDGWETLLLMKDLRAKIDQQTQQLQDGVANAVRQVLAGLKQEVKTLKSEMASLKQGQEERPLQVDTRTPNVKEDLGSAHLSCPPGMTFTRWGCYKAFNNIGKTWDGASSHCASLGLELASLHRVHTKEHLFQLGREAGLIEGIWYWVHLTRSLSGDGLWRWSNGAPLELWSPLWWDGQPNGESDETGYFRAGKGLGDLRRRATKNFLCAALPPFKGSNNSKNNNEDDNNK